MDNQDKIWTPRHGKMPAINHTAIEPNVRMEIYSKTAPCFDRQTLDGMDYTL